MVKADGGWTGSILDVDLTTGRIGVLDAMPLQSRFLGGSGLGQAVILDQVPIGTTPLDPENVAVLSAGPLVGTAAPASGRLSIDSMNAVTGGVNFSNVGGHFAPELKYAGFDAVILRGRAERPVYLQVVDGQARLVDAQHLWGKTTGETEDAIRAEMGDQRARVLSIGPAGENLTLSGCVIVDRARAAGRGAAGSVLGSKKLKAVAVRGTQPVRVARPGPFMAEVNRVLSRLAGTEQTRIFHQYGTFLSMPTMNELCRLPYRNNQDDHMDPARLDPVHPDILVKNYRIRKLSCFNCPSACDNFFSVREGEYAGATCTALEENTMENFLARFDMNDPAALIAITSLCAELGLDIDNSSVVGAWAFECFERGLLTTADTGGLELRWGDHRAMVSLLKQLAYREGLGELLALGIREAARRLGPEAERLALHVKGQELCETMRATKGWALGIVVATRGGTHMDGAPRVERWKISPEFGQERFGHPLANDSTTMEGKPETVFFYDCFKALVDSLGVCYLLSAWASPDSLWQEDYAALLSAATGRDYTGNELTAIGRQIFNMKKAFNTLHRGFTRQDDLPPIRLIEEPIRSGARQGDRFEPGEWNRALDRYYAVHGWDVATGWQTASGLSALGLEEAAARLDAAGRLPTEGVRQ